MAISDTSACRGRSVRDEIEELYRANFHMIYRTAYGITGRTQDAEDVLQGVFLKVLRGGSLSVLKGINPQGYLYRAAVNLSLDKLDSRRRYVPIAETRDLATPSTAPVQKTAENRERLSAAFAKLKPRDVEILILRYEHEYTDTEIAQILGTSRGAIAVNLSKSRARLRKALRVLQK